MTYSPLFDRYPVVIAHRGASGDAPENTLPAFHLAIEKYGVDMIELDVQCSQDGVPVVFHDETLERTTNGTGLVSRSSLSELKLLDAGFRFDPTGDGPFPFREKGVRIPTLEEVLRMFPKTHFCVEMKGNDLETAQRTLDVIKRAGTRPAVPMLVGSFNGSLARKVRSAALPSVETALARDEVIRMYLAFRFGLKRFRPPCRYASLPPSGRGFRLDSEEWIRFLHDRGVRVFYWAINDPVGMKNLLAAGADGIVTNFPGKLNQILRR